MKKDLKDLIWRKEYKEFGTIFDVLKLNIVKGPFDYAGYYWVTSGNDGELRDDIYIIDKETKQVWVTDIFCTPPEVYEQPQVDPQKLRELL